MTAKRLVAGGLLSAATAAPVLASEGGGSALIQPQIGTFVWTLLTFVLMLFLLGRYAWKPLLGALDARQKSIQGSLDAARQRHEEAERTLEEQRKLLVEARRERAAALEQGRRDAEGVKDEILAQAQQQREQLLAQTEAQVRAGLREAHTELRATAVDLAILAAEKLLTKNLDEATQRKLVEDYLTDLERSSGSSPSPSA